MYTLKVNIRAQEERARREKERSAKEAISKLQSTTGPAPRGRKRKGLNFHEPGTFIAQGEQLRKKARFEALLKKTAAITAKAGITDAVKLASLTTTKTVDKASSATVSTIQEEEEVPELEWWDIPVAGNKSLYVILALDDKNVEHKQIYSGITNLIEHPPIKKPLGVASAVLPVPIFLTKKERQKLRRQNRKNVELEKQEQIKLGLLPKPEPKLKRSNIMYALGDQAIVQPSMAEQVVREQVERRMQAHIEHNESKKLTLEEKRAKKMRKIQEDLNMTGTWSSVYRILNMNSQSNRYKVAQNARQLTMTGVLVLYKDINLVVVEGGPKQQRKFKHLMLDRIRWADDPIVGDNDSDKSPTSINKCLLVWEGQVSQRFFRGFKVKPMSSETEAKEFFQQSKVGHYWDLAFKKSILQSMEDV